jgi:hypothetical protein
MPHLPAAGPARWAPPLALARHPRPAPSGCVRRRDI